jgi:hypothetical protein
MSESSFKNFSIVTTEMLASIEEDKFSSPKLSDSQALEILNKLLELSLFIKILESWIRLRSR